MTAARAQSTVVGVAVLVAATVVAMSAMTATVGTVVDRQATAASVDRVAAGFAEGLDPHASGPGRERVPTPGGGVRVVDREVRVLASDRVATTVDANGLVYGSGSDRVAYVAGAVTRGEGDASLLRRGLPVSVHRDDIVVGVSGLGTDPGYATDASGVVLRTNVSHERRRLPADSYRLAVETSAPRALAAVAPEGTDTTRRDLDGDGVPSVVFDFPGDGEFVLTVHHLDAEVTAG